MIQSRLDDSLSCFLAAVYSATSRLTASAHERILLTGGWRSSAACEPFVPRVCGIFFFFFARTALPLHFDEQGCVFLLRARDAVTFPPDAPRLRPSVAGEILADEIFSYSSARIRGAFNVCIRETLCSDEWLKDSSLFF